MDATAKIETSEETSRDIRVFIEGNPNANVPMSMDDPNASCIERELRAINILLDTVAIRGACPGVLET